MKNKCPDFKKWYTNDNVENNKRSYCFIFKNFAVSQMCKRSLLWIWLSCFCLFTFSAFSSPVEWHGAYRVEGVFVNNIYADSTNTEKDYGTSHLILSPKILAADSLVIYSRLDIFNSNTNSLVGQFLGHGPQSSKTTTTNSSDSNVLTETQVAEDIQVTWLYLKWIQESGEFVAGRAPYSFGLGITHQGGEKSTLSHWLDTRDWVGYKIIMGNMFFFPRYAKVSEGDLAIYDDVIEYIFEFQYENPDTDLEIGVLYEMRKASVSGNDLPQTTPPIYGGTGAQLDDKYDTQRLSVFVLKDTPRYRVGIEAAFNSGSVGVHTALGQNVKASGFGVALEYEWRPEASKWKYGIMSGFASGDDPSTDDDFEGFFFHRGYNVAFLLFNHSLGYDNLLRTQAIGGYQLTSVDTETISNVLYLSPYAKYHWKEHWDLKWTLTSGLLNEPVSTTINNEKNLGIELDTLMEYRPFPRLRLGTVLALFSAGNAFELDGTQDTGLVWGLQSYLNIEF